MILDGLFGLRQDHRLVQFASVSVIIGHHLLLRCVVLYLLHFGLEQKWARVDHLRLQRLRLSVLLAALLGHIVPIDLDLDVLRVGGEKGLVADCALLGDFSTRRSMLAGKDT